MKKPVDMQEFMARLRQEYMESTRDRLERFEDILEKLHDVGGDDPELLMELQRDVHSMKGSAGSYGFPAISAIAHHLEDYLETCETLSKENLYDIETFIETIRTVIYADVQPEGDVLAAIRASLPTTAKPKQEAKMFSAQATRDVYVMLVMPRGLQRKIISTELASCGFHVQLAENGAEAIARLLAHPADLVLVAMELPDMTGGELAAVLGVLSKTQAAKAAVLTSYDRDDARLKDLPSGVPVVRKGEAFTEDLTNCLTDFGIFH